MTKIYRYHLIDDQGNYLEKDIPEESQAQTIANFIWESQGVQVSIEKEHVPQLHGHRLGRDPDLH
jgi:hypothetical protein